ncbi:MAG: tetratricopeptide repeat protein [Cyanobacteria bacterium P01_H01_bin.74]
MKKHFQEFIKNIRYYHKLANDYQKAVENSPDHGLAYVNWGKSLRQQGDLKTAIEKFETASRISPKRYEIFVNWGILLAQQGNLKEATEKFKAAHHKQPKAAFPLILWATALVELGETEEGLKIHKQAIELAPNHPGSYGSYAISLSKASIFEEAIIQIQKSLALHKKQPDLFFLWATLLAHKKQFSEAIDKLKIFLEFKPKSAEGYYHWAAILQQMNKLEEALKPSEKAIALYQEKNGDAYLLHGNLLAAQEKHEEAVSFFQKALQINENLWGAYYSWGISLCSQHHYQQGFQQFSKALSLVSDDKKLEQAIIHAEWGRFLNHNKQYNEASQHLLKAIEQQYVTKGILLDIAIAFFSLNQDAKAVAYLEQLLLLDKWNADAHFLLGAYYFRKNITPSAEKHLNIAVKEKPDFKDAVINLAILYCETGQIDEAIRKIRPLYRKLPDDPTVNFNYAIILFQNRDFEEAKEKYKNALAHMDSSQSVINLTAKIGLAECYIETHVFTEANRLLKELAEKMQLSSIHMFPQGIPPTNIINSTHYLLAKTLILQSIDSFVDYYLEKKPFQSEYQKEAFFYVNSILDTEPSHSQALLLKDFLKKFETITELTQLALPDQETAATLTKTINSFQSQNKLFGSPVNEKGTNTNYDDGLIHYFRGALYLYANFKSPAIQHFQIAHNFDCIFATPILGALLNPSNG